MSKPVFILIGVSGEYDTINEFPFSRCFSTREEAEAEMAKALKANAEMYSRIREIQDRVRENAPSVINDREKCKAYYASAEIQAQLNEADQMNRDFSCRFGGNPEDDLDVHIVELTLMEPFDE